MILYKYREDISAERFFVYYCKYHNLERIDGMVTGSVFVKYYLNGSGCLLRDIRAKNEHSKLYVLNNDFV